LGEKVGELGPSLVAFVLFPILASLIFRSSRKVFWPALATCGILACYVSGLLTAFRQAQVTLRPSNFPHTFIYANVVFAAYIGLIVASYLTLVNAQSGSRRAVNLAFFMPLLQLLLVREVFPKFDHFDRDGTVLVILGVSYVSFRLCFLVSEVANNAAPLPSLSQYLAFAFFPPLVFVGPIQPYAGFYAATLEGHPNSIDVNRAVLRILVGAVKFMFLSAVFAEFGYGVAFLGDGHLHSRLDLAIALLVYPIYLYCNFSGLCDMAIGVSGLLGIPVIENFDRPFQSRNFQEFWTKWHISLTAWIRVMVFTPLVKNLSRGTSPTNIPHVIAVGIMASFTLIGLWHGLSLHYFLYGLSQGVGVAFVAYWNPWVRKKLGKNRFTQFRASKIGYWGGVCLTYLYFAATLFLFANTTDQAKLILSHIR